MEEIKKYSQKTFEDIKKITSDNVEFWFARDLQNILEYSDWRNFSNVIAKAKKACIHSGNNVFDHFVDINKMIDIGKGATREIDDIELSRYACYLIVQNGDPSKKVIALGQTYFAQKTRQKEIEDDFAKLTEEEKRIAIRNDLNEHNKSLAESAKLSGVIEPKDYAIFQNFGYKGLYDGLGAKDIHKKKGLKKSEQILDHMGSTELAANLFRATQTDEKLRRENIAGKDNANKAHFEVGSKVRKTIEELGGTMPEELPTPEKNVKKLEKDKDKGRIEDK